MRYMIRIRMPSTLVKSFDVVEDYPLTATTETWALEQAVAKLDNLKYQQPSIDWQVQVETWTSSARKYKEVVHTFDTVSKTLEAAYNFKEVIV